MEENNEREMPELTMEQIDKMLEIKMGFMEREYEKCKKYDNKCNMEDNPDALKLQGSFEQNTLDGVKYENSQKKSDLNKEIQQSMENDQQDQDQEKQQQDQQQKNQENNEDNNKLNQNEDNQNNNDDGNSDNENDEDIQQQGYEQIGSDGEDNQDNDDEWGEMQTAKIDVTSQPPSQDPRTKEIDVEKIKFYMSQFTLKEPDWAKDSNALRNKLENFAKKPF